MTLVKEYNSATPCLKALTSATDLAMLVYIIITAALIFLRIPTTGPKGTIHRELLLCLSRDSGIYHKTSAFPLSCAFA